MPSASRIVFVSIPFLLTLATIAGLTLTYTGNISTNSIAQTFWFFGLDTSKAHLATSEGAGTTILENLPGWYSVGLWNYCTGHASSHTPTFCSKSSFGYFFNPIKVLDLPSDVVELIPAKYTKDLSSLSALSKWASIAYLVAIILAVVTIPVSILAFKRRLGSLLAAALSAATCLFAIGASTAATVMYAILLGIVKEGFGGEYNIKAEVHTSALAATWLASAAATVAFFFWLFTACCCRGRVAGEGKARQTGPQTRTMTGEKYQRIGLMGPSDAHHGPAYANAGAGYNHGLPAQKYEPYAHRS